MWEDWTWRVSVDVSVERVVSVARSVDAFGCCAGIIVDGFVVWPGGGYFWDIAQWAENSSAGVNGVGGPYVI